MIALIQRVSQACVLIDGHTSGSIDRGLLVLLCAERGDTALQADKLLDKLLHYRVFGDAAGKMNLSVQDVQGGLLIVSQFTLAADTRSGTRPSFGPAADPVTGKQLYEYFVAKAAATKILVQTGQFGADMQVSLVNDGPVTFWLQIKPPVSEVV
jgi:D-tyrosyl-tRNA(Tyr) deacylase